jgi:protein-S-isoprenylcysteine O-methyltransferase Ste14
MSDLKTMPAALEALLRPRQMARVKRTVARSRAEGAWFDALLWTVFALVGVGVLLCGLNFVDARRLAAHGIDKDWLVAGGLLIAIVVAGTLWWRWFKWHVHAVDLSERPAESETK